MMRKFKRLFLLSLTALLLVSWVLPAVSQRASALSYSGSAGYMSGKYYRALTQVKRTGDPRTDIVNVARSQVGYQEGGSWNQLSGEVYGGVNYTEYGSWYGVQDMWCAMFVSWCANVAGIGTDVIPKHSFTPDGLAWFRNRGRAYSRAKVEAGEYTPQAGDLIYYKSVRNKNTTNHVGIVTGYSDGVVYTIEGNAVCASIMSNGGTVAQKAYPITNTYIVYICCPDYEVTGTRVPHSDSGLDTLRKTIYELETGGEAGYDRVTDAYGVITVGSGQWHGVEARDLLLRIRQKDQETFAWFDTAGVGQDLDNLDWSGYCIGAGSEKAQCISQILGSAAGIQVQDKMMNEKLHQYQMEAAALGVEDAKAQLLCAGLRHFGGAGTLERVLNKVPGAYTVENMRTAVEGTGYAERICDILSK